MSVRAALIALLIASFIGLTSTAGVKQEVVRYARFQAGDVVAYGILEGEKIRQLSGDLFGSFKKTDKTFSLDEVTLLPVSQPSQVLALAGNYKSHLGDDNVTTTTVTTTTTLKTDNKTGKSTSDTKTAVETRKSGEIPSKLQIPQPFFKSPSCLVGQGGDIVLPPDSGEVHFEAELVIVIGKRARNVSKDSALDYVLGVTCGNDISARVWQRNDVQWWRAKGSDTFGPCGPYIAAGLDYDNLDMELRVNGQVMQKENTDHMIQDVATTVSFISRHVTLNPGDLIFTGTPGKTSALKAGDVVEVEIKGVGVLRNNVVDEK